MSGSHEQMSKLDMKKDAPKLSQVQLDYMKIIEQQNMERVRKLAKTRRNNILTASLLGVGVISIYAYSILSVKQEKFLDEID
ncbi:Cytochrome c oxidase assembly factor 3, mitochondrial [Armadillidium nasatum]|uniref:Cytochrome c oxidase assembly factor 3 n=1 Tax=Armadillidium nasatum TaxID=96803 RepID=A0A5N5SWC1_9CRUS|nr:Cytochrome c oxidase assembly factor 3, mitochondrial [Armadillidium nasatum]